jgi:hypothetical protein
MKILLEEEKEKVSKENSVSALLKEKHERELDKVKSALQVF